MNNNSLSKGHIEENSIGIGEISGEMIAERGKELALIAGRPMIKDDYEQALRELTGGSEIDGQQELLESLAEDKRWQPIPSSTGHQVEDRLSDTQDEDGRSQNAQLVEEGVREAEHDQMLQAAKKSIDEDQLD